MTRVPRATYRIQLRSGFGFHEVGQLSDYLQLLGMSDIYLSPLFRARKDSSHGYDVVNHAAIEQEFGSRADFETVAHDIRQRKMGILLDLVPNHMGINDVGNTWWGDVLENGELSRYAHHFDIDWNRLSENLRHKILLPVLGDPFGEVLERGELKLGYSRGKFQVHYFENTFPVAPLTWPTILQPALDRLLQDERNEAHPHQADVEELESIITQLQNLPEPTDHTAAASRRRYREQAVASRRLVELIDRAPAVQEALDVAVQSLNGVAGEAASFDSLETLLDQQWYRLAYWRVAADEINYRRFFDINDLAAIRVEEPEVFDAVHQLIEQLLCDDLVTGVRIDHPDGLLDPARYFEDLQKLYQRCRRPAEGDSPNNNLYIVVEKILSGEEPLPSDWSVCGTTGYELLNDLNLVLVEASGVAKLRHAYGDLTGVTEPVNEIVYQSKMKILNEAMSSEVGVLAGRLHRLTQRHRLARDFTYPTLLRALKEVIACFPVYRTYVPAEGWDVDSQDYARVMTAIRWAKRRNPTMAPSVLDFVAKVLLLQYPARFDEPDRESFRDFVLRFQQITGPVTAKGIEDTSFYRYYPLISLNEVGAELDAAPAPVDAFHRRMQHRAADWPNGLSATATHDTKRGEDVRARLHVLSELPDEWIATVGRWQNENRLLLKTINDEQVPSRNEEYLIYQTLVGIWPFGEMAENERSSFTERVVQYVEKALREAKVNTSWANPAEQHEAAVLDFTRGILNPQRSPKFLQQLQQFVNQIAHAGFLNSLSQVLLKATVPGVPDFYQGTEFWDFSLVDPDNRRPVDYSQRQQALEEMCRQYQQDPSRLEADLLRAWPDPRIKLFVAWRALQARAAYDKVFERGDYIPLKVSGALSSHILAFARDQEDQWALTAVGLHLYPWTGPHGSSVPDSACPAIPWEDTTIELPAEAPRIWRNAFTQNLVESNITGDDKRQIAIADWLHPLPIGLLTSSEQP